MAWMLQPHNYTQVIRPNLYNVAYRRVGTYKGMGQTNGSPSVAYQQTLAADSEARQFSQLSNPQCDWGPCTPQGVPYTPISAYGFPMVPAVAPAPTATSAATTATPNWLGWAVAGAAVWLFMRGNK